MTRQELEAQLEDMRRQLKQKDNQIRKCLQENSKLKREAQQLTLKLQFEIQSNQMLAKNLNRMRVNYFQQINTPTSPLPQPNEEGMRNLTALVSRSGSGGV